MGYFEVENGRFLKNIGTYLPVCTKLTVMSFITDLRTSNCSVLSLLQTYAPLIIHVTVIIGSWYTLNSLYSSTVKTFKRVMKNQQ
jgi:hypothetical protein